MKISQASKIFRVGLIAAVAALAFGSASAVMAKDFHYDWSGWFMFNSDADVNGDLFGGGENNWSGTGTFGRSDSHSVTDIVFVGTPCDLDPDIGDQSGLTLEAIAHSNILRTRNGDQLFRVLSSSPPSTFCANFLTGVAISTVYLDVVGGTGRFENATGSTILKVKVQAIGKHNSILATEDGHVFLVEGDDDDDD